MLVFFFTSSKLTKYGEEKKRIIDADFKEGGQRDWYGVDFCPFLKKFRFACLLDCLVGLDLDFVVRIARVCCLREFTYGLSAIFFFFFDSCELAPLLV